MRVLFNEPKEFLEELSKEAGNVDRRIVRITWLFRQEKNLPLTHVSLVATARIHDDVVRLEARCGTVMAGCTHDEAGQLDAKAREIESLVQEECRRLGLDVRAGILEDTC